MAKFFVVTASLHRIITIVCPATSTAVQRQAFASTWSKCMAPTMMTATTTTLKKRIIMTSRTAGRMRGAKRSILMKSPNQETSPLIPHGKTAMSTTLKTRSICGCRHHLMMMRSTTQRRAMKKTLKSTRPSAILCGHVYCVQCIRAAPKYTEACPVCDERATEDQFRKIYISQE
ncbi:hypothetical protein EDD85DRAFT_101025 [Armillaria nabsnona]|nr:hypothetical protein EDD85DRAFT_101025 [Armillaria nabsnona]